MVCLCCWGQTVSELQCAEANQPNNAHRPSLISHAAHPVPRSAPAGPCSDASPLRNHAERVTHFQTTAQQGPGRPEPRNSESMVGHHSMVSALSAMVVERIGSLYVLIFDSPMPRGFGPQVSRLVSSPDICMYSLCLGVILPPGSSKRMVSCASYARHMLENTPRSEYTPMIQKGMASR